MNNPEPMTFLNFEGDQITLCVTEESSADNAQTLQVGSRQNLISRLQHEPATAYELEAAIADIEDALMPVIALLPEHRNLATSEPDILQIAKVIGEQDDLTLESVELLYNRLADMAYGTPSAHLGVPETREFTASVLFIRELMHHAGFDVIHIHAE